MWGFTVRQVTKTKRFEAINERMQSVGCFAIGTTEELCWSIHEIGFFVKKPKLILQRATSPKLRGRKVPYRQSALLGCMRAIDIESGLGSLLRIPEILRNSCFH